MAVEKKKIEEAKKLIYDFFDILDKSGTNTKYYKELFANMSDTQFVTLMKRKYPIKFQLRQSVTEPTMADIVDACKFTGVPLLEKISLPYLYTNKEGKAVSTAECLVGYQHIKKVQQIVTKKSKWGLSTENRDMKTGRLIGADKGTAMSDREFEGLATLGLDYTTYEFSKPRADYMKAKASMNAAINTKGYATIDDVPNDIDDSLSRNMVDVYLTSAMFATNLVNQDGYTPYTLAMKRKKIEREG